MSEYTETIIFLYSKQCPSSMQILKKLRNINITKISVDHPTIRNKILSSTNVNVERVPSFIYVANTDGNTEIKVYENNIENILQDILQDVETNVENNDKSEINTIENNHTPFNFEENSEKNNSKKPFVLEDNDINPLENINPSTLTSVVEKGPKKSAQEMAKEMQKQREEMFSQMKNNRM
jgi:hypothetical protein